MDIHNSLIEKVYHKMLSEKPSSSGKSYEKALKLLPKLTKEDRKRLHSLYIIDTSYWDNIVKQSTIEDNLSEKNEYSSIKNNSEYEKQRCMQCGKVNKIYFDFYEDDILCKNCNNFIYQ